MEMYPSNSHKSKESVADQQPTEDIKKVERVVATPVKTKKKSGFGKMLGTIVSDDAKDIKTYLVSDIVVPTIKKTISDTVDMILFGGSRKNRSTAGRVSYRSYYDEPRARDMREPVATTSYSYDDIIIGSRGEAEEVLTRLNELIDTYQIASVADLYDLVGLARNFTDNNYGWTNLSSAYVVRVRDGYMLKLPRACPIK